MNVIHSHWTWFLCTWLTIVICTATANADEFHVDRVEIQLDGCDHSPDQIFLVLNDDGNELTAGRKPGTTNVWSWDAVSPLPFDPRTAYASVRFKGARTGCRLLVKWGKDERDTSKQVARFRFPSCGDRTIVDLSLTTSPAINMSTTRELPATQRDGSLPCKENVPFFSDRIRTFRSFWPGPEMLTLYLFTQNARAEQRELPVNALLADVNEKRKGAVRKGTFVGPGKASFLWSVQRAKGKGSGPTIAPAAIDIDVRILDRMHFNWLKLTVAE
jgi:hypothetical protein